jgi:hypothetical protein
VVFTPIAIGARFCGPVVEIPDARNRLLARIFFPSINPL